MLCQTIFGDGVRKNRGLSFAISVICMSGSFGMREIRRPLLELDGWVSEFQLQC